MSLDHKSPGNPNWVKGKSANPNGRPKHGLNLKTLLKVASTLADKKRHPVEELIRIADKAEAASSNVVITKPGCTSWKAGEIVTKIDFAAMCAAVKNGEMPEAKAIPGVGGTELAAKIWADLLKYCEPQKKPVEVAPEKPTTPEESKAAAESAMAYLQELENGPAGENTRTESSDQIRLGDGETKVSSEEVPEKDLRSDKGE